MERVFRSFETRQKVLQSFGEYWFLQGYSALERSVLVNSLKEHLKTGMPERTEVVSGVLGLQETSAGKAAETVSDFGDRSPLDSEQPSISMFEQTVLRDQVQPELRIFESNPGNVHRKPYLGADDNGSVPNTVPLEDMSVQSLGPLHQTVILSGTRPAKCAVMKVWDDKNLIALSENYLSYLNDAKSSQHQPAPIIVFIDREVKQRHANVEFKGDVPSITPEYIYTQILKAKQRLPKRLRNQTMVKLDTVKFDNDCTDAESQVNQFLGDALEVLRQADLMHYLSNKATCKNFFIALVKRLPQEIAHAINFDAKEDKSIFYSLPKFKSSVLSYLDTIEKYNDLRKKGKLDNTTKTAAATTQWKVGKLLSDSDALQYPVPKLQPGQPRQSVCPGCKINGLDHSHWFINLQGSKTCPVMWSSDCYKQYKAIAERWQKQIAKKRASNKAARLKRKAAKAKDSSNKDANRDSTHTTGQGVGSETSEGDILAQIKSRQSKDPHFIGRMLANCKRMKVRLAKCTGKAVVNICSGGKKVTTSALLDSGADTTVFPKHYMAHARNLEAINPPVIIELADEKTYSTASYRGNLDLEMQVSGSDIKPAAVEVTDVPTLFPDGDWGEALVGRDVQAHLGILPEQNMGHLDGVKISCAALSTANMKEEDEAPTDCITS